MQKFHSIWQMGQVDTRADDNKHTKNSIYFLSDICTTLLTLTYTKKQKTTKLS